MATHQISIDAQWQLLSRLIKGIEQLFTPLAISNGNRSVGQNQTVVAVTTEEMSLFQSYFRYRVEITKFLQGQRFQVQRIATDFLFQS